MKITHLIVSFRIKNCYRTFAVWKQLLHFLCHCPSLGLSWQHRSRYTSISSSRKDMTLLPFVHSACSDGAGLRCWRHKDVITTSCNMARSGASSLHGSLQLLLRNWRSWMNCHRSPWDQSASTAIRPCPLISWGWHSRNICALITCTRVFFGRRTRASSATWRRFSTMPRISGSPRHRRWRCSTGSHRLRRCYATVGGDFCYGDVFSYPTSKIKAILSQPCATLGNFFLLSKMTSTWLFFIGLELIYALD